MGHVQASLVTSPKFILAQVASRFLILTTPGSYKSNVAKILKHTFYSSYIPYKRKKAIQKLKLEQKDIWGQIYWDKYYKEKGVGAIRIDICWNSRTKNENC